MRKFILATCCAALMSAASIAPASALGNGPNNENATSSSSAMNAQNKKKYRGMITPIYRDARHGDSAATAAVADAST